MFPGENVQAIRLESSAEPTHEEPSLAPPLIAQDRSAMNSSLQLRQFRMVACWFWGRTLCLLLSVVLPVTCFALEIRRVQTCSGMVLRLRGDIKEGDFSQLKSHFRRKEAIVGFDLISDGGSLEEGLRIADLTRRKKLTVYVAGECNSACSDVFLLQQNGILNKIQRSVFMLFLTIEISKTWGLNF
jgi:hypothetical protein